jgi:hypothetical protein
MRRIACLFLACFFLFSCAPTLSNPPALTNNSTTTIKQKCDTGLPFGYVQRLGWESPFDPHEVLTSWQRLWTGSVTQRETVVVMGNPKVKWDQEKLNLLGLDAKLIKVPPGEETAVILFIFVTTPIGTVELAGYGYYDDIGIQHLFVWDGMKYAKKVDHKKQNDI